MLKIISNNKIIKLNKIKVPKINEYKLKLIYFFIKTKMKQNKKTHIKFKLTESKLIKINM